MTRTHGRGPRGARVVCPVPHGPWKTTTFVGVLGVAGIQAPLVVDGAMNGDVFTADIQQHVVKILEPADILIMDNLPTHKRVEAKKAVEAAGCELIFLPPYSPDLNPIELALAKLKALLGKAGKRTVAE